MNEVFLSKGAHTTPDKGRCAMEYAAYLAGERHTDRPECVSPVLLDFMIRWNDGLDDETRQKLRPYIVRTLGTAGDGQDEKRSYMALDWLIRTHTPAFLEVAGLTEEANTLRGLPGINGIEEAREAGVEVRAARTAAREAAREAANAAARGAASAAADAAAWEAADAAAWEAADAAAWEAASATAREAASAAAREAAREAANAAAWEAADAAARTAAREAAWEAANAALQPTMAMLQASAFELLDRMIDPNGIHDMQTEEHYLQKLEVS